MTLNRNDLTDDAAYIHDALVTLQQIRAQLTSEAFQRVLNSMSESDKLHLQMFFKNYERVARANGYEE